MVIFITTVFCLFNLTSCSDTADNNDDSKTSKSQSKKAEFSFEEDKTDYKYKSTEALLANKKNLAGNGYVIIRDKNDIPDYMKDILVPFCDEKSNLYGYKNLMGDVKIEPKFCSASEFADNKFAIVHMSGDVNDAGTEIVGPGIAIKTDGSSITDSQKMYVSWVGADYIKYNDINDDNKVHVVNEDLKELDMSTYFKDYPQKSKTDISPENLGYNEIEGYTDEISYGRYQNGFLPYTKLINTEDNVNKIVSGLLNKGGEAVAEYDCQYISSVSNSFYVVFNDFGGYVYDENHNKVTDQLCFKTDNSARPVDKIIYPGGYTYVYFETKNGTEPFVIKIASELYKDKK